MQKFVINPDPSTESTWVEEVVSCVRQRLGQTRLMMNCRVMKQGSTSQLLVDFFNTRGKLYCVCLTLPVDTIINNQCRVGRLISKIQQQLKNEERLTLAR